MKYVLVCLLFAFSQNDYAQSPYVEVDSVMRSYKDKIKSADDLYKLINFIRKNFTADSVCLRASFIWITDNIDYDVKALQNDDPRAARIDYIVQNKKAICGGYSNLLKYFCDAFAIECRVVEGRARGAVADVNIGHMNFTTNHSWNAVFVNNQWRLIDATWAAGFVSNDEDPKKRKYAKDFQAVYYFTPPEKLILNHYPKLLQFTFLPKAITAAEFMRRPLFTTRSLHGDILKLKPDSALLQCKVGDTLRFRFRASYKPAIVYVVSERDKKTYSSGVTPKGDEYEFVYPVQAFGYSNLYVGFDDPSPSVVYKLKADTKL